MGKLVKVENLVGLALNYAVAKSLGAPDKAPEPASYEQVKNLQVPFLLYEAVLNYRDDDSIAYDENNLVRDHLLLTSFLLFMLLRCRPRKMGSNSQVFFIMKSWKVWGVG